MESLSKSVSRREAKRTVSAKSPRADNMNMLSSLHTISLDKSGRSAETDKLIDDLYAESMNLSNSAETKAVIFKAIYIFSAIMIIALSSATSVLGFTTGATTVNQTNLLVDNNTKTNILFALGVIGVVITLIKTFTSVFKLETKGKILKDNSLQLRDIARKAKLLRTQDLSMHVLVQKLEKLYVEVDNIDRILYSESVDNIAMREAD